MYPNPLSGNQLYIDLTFQEKQTAVISIYDLTGRKIKEMGNQIFEDGNQTFTYTLSDIPS